MEPVFPNPVSALAHIGLKVKEATRIKVEIFSSIGQYIETIFSAPITPGDYKIDFSTENLANGVYTCKMRAGKSMDSKNFIVSH